MKYSGSNLWRGPVLLVLPLAMLVALAAWQLLRPLWIPETPEPRGWLEAARHVRGRWQSGDVVRIEPTWLTEGRVYFGDVDGGARTPFRALDLHAPLDLPFLYRFERLWLVTAVESQERGTELTGNRFELVEALSFPGLTVGLYKVPQGYLSWQMLENVPRAMPGVHVEIREVAGGPRRCLLVRPAPAGQELMLRFPSFRAEGQFLVRAGNTVEAARSKDGGTVRVEVAVDGTPAGELVLERASYRFDGVTHGLAGAAPHELVVRLTTTDDRKREVCLDGYVLAPDAVP